DRRCDRLESAQVPEVVMRAPHEEPDHHVGDHQQLLEHGSVSPSDEDGHGNPSDEGSYPFAGETSPSASARAAAMCERCVRPCGKFPSISFASTSYSSANSPRSFAVAHAASKASRASPHLPWRARHSDSQKDTTRNAPSVPARPSRAR